MLSVKRRLSYYFDESIPWLLSYHFHYAMYCNYCRCRNKENARTNDITRQLIGCRKLSAYSLWVADGQLWDDNRQKMAKESYLSNRSKYTHFVIKSRSYDQSWVRSVAEYTSGLSLNARPIVKRYISLVTEWYKKNYPPFCSLFTKRLLGRILSHSTLITTLICSTYVPDNLQYYCT